MESEAVLNIFAGILCFTISGNTSDWFLFSVVGAAKGWLLAADVGLLILLVIRPTACFDSWKKYAPSFLVANLPTRILIGNGGFGDLGFCGFGRKICIVVIYIAGVWIFTGLAVFWKSRWSPFSGFQRLIQDLCFHFLNKVKRANLPKKKW